MSNNWRLEALSIAAKNRKKKSFVLKAGENKVGKMKDSEIKIPSVLCSREHCTILLDGDTVTVKDTSRNGTYITFSGVIGTKHYIATATERSLEQNDLISFGFNTATVYEVDDKNAFIYKLTKEEIETIDIGDSDDDSQPLPPPPPSKDKIIDISNKIIDIDSDSDSVYSGDEYLKNIDENKEDESDEQSSVSSVDSLDPSLDDSESVHSIESDDESFVVTKTILKCGAPTETISIDDDDDDEEEEAEEEEEGDVPEEEKEAENDDEVKEIQGNQNDKAANGTVVEPSTSKHDQKPTESVKTSVDDVQRVDIEPKVKVNAEKSEKQSSPVQNIEPEASTSDTIRLQNLKQRLAQKPPKKIAITYARPQIVRKRRQTISEDDYNERKKQKKLDAERNKQLRKEQLANIGAIEKAKREAAAENAGESSRTPAVPKVKNPIVSRSDQLLTDMLALDQSIIPEKKPN